MSGARMGRLDCRTYTVPWSNRPMPFSPIPEILEELKAGRPIVLVDDEDRENEGDVVFAAERCTPEAVNFMITHARGYVCLALTGDQCAKSRLHPPTHINPPQLGTASTL